MTTAQLFVDAARSELGYTECPRDAHSHCLFTGHGGVGRNHTKFAAEAHLANGVFWCAVFVSAIAARCGVVLPSGPTASTRTLRAGFVRAGTWVGAQQVQVGMVLLYHLTGRNGPGEPDHTGICVGVIRNKAGVVTHVIAVEGNTSSDHHGSQDNGGGVYQRVRPVSVVLGAGRLFTAAPPAATDPSEEEEAMLARVMHFQGAICLVGYDPAVFTGTVKDAAGNVVKVTASGPWVRVFPDVSRMEQVIRGGACITKPNPAPGHEMGDAFEVTNAQFEQVYVNRGDA